jgi:hypothetical protein
MWNMTRDSLHPFPNSRVLFSVNTTLSTPLRLIPSETELQPPLPTIVGNVDYHDFRTTLLRMDELLLASGAEEQWMRRSLVHRLEHAAPRAQHHAKYQLIVQTHSRRALRCNLARVLLKEDFRGFSTRLADSPLLQHFVGIGRLDTIRVPSKSTLERYEKWLPEAEVRATVEMILQAAAQPVAQGQQPLDLAEPLDLEVYFLDTTCVMANIHFPVDWVLLRDGVGTLLAAIELIRHHGLKHRMPDPKELRRQMNRLCIQMTHARRRKDSKKTRKAVLRQMKKLVRVVRAHAQRYRVLLDQEWNETTWTRPQAEQVLRRIDSVLTQLPAAQKQAHERIIGERAVPNAEKILSLYESEVHVMVRGKAGAEVEFGNALVLGEADDGIIVDWQLIRDRVPADSTQVVPSAERVRGIFGEAVRGVVTDRGCESKSNAQKLESYRWANGICPKDPAVLAEKMKEEKFRGWQRRRGQTEGRISIFKREFLGRPMRSKGYEHRALQVSWGVLTHNLWWLARRERKSEAAEQARAA